MMKRTRTSIAGLVVAAAVLVPSGTALWRLSDQQNELRRQTEQFEMKIRQVDAQQSRIRCKSIAQIVAIPIPSPVTGNPSRVWEAAYEAVQRQRGTADGCRLPAAQYTRGGK